MSEINQTRKPLPESLMKTIRVIVTSAMSGQDKFEAVLLIANSYGLYAEAESLDPTNYAMPHDQWLSIADLLAEHLSDDPTTQVNAVLSWMNIGPSSYVPEEVTG